MDWNNPAGNFYWRCEEVAPSDKESFVKGGDGKAEVIFSGTGSVLPGAHFVDMILFDQVNGAIAFSLNEQSVLRDAFNRESFLGQVLGRRRECHDFQCLTCYKLQNTNLTWRVV